MGGDHHVDSYWTRATPSTLMNLSGQVTREQLTPNFWRIVSTPLLVSDGSPPAAPFLAHRRYCLCELFSPCWRFTLATSTDGLLPLSFSVGGILAGTKNFSSFFFGRSFWLFWCELFVSVGVIPRFTRRVESSSSFKLFFCLSWNGNIRRRGRQFLIYEREIGFVRVCLCILFRNSTGSLIMIKFMMRLWLDYFW